MDKLDRMILFDLYNNCRVSYQELAEKHGLTVSAIWRRVKQLEKLGIIEYYSVELNPNRIRIHGILVIATVDGTVDERILEESLAKIDWMTSVSAITNRTCTLMLESPDRALLLESTNQIMAMPGISAIDTYSLGCWLEAWEDPVEPDGIIPKFSAMEIEVLKLLIEDPRASISEIRKHLTYSYRKVKQVLENLLDSGSVRFTIRITLRVMNVVYRITFSDDITTERIVRHIETAFPEKYMWTFPVADSNTVFSQMLVDSLDDAAKIREEIKKLKGIDIVESLFQRPSFKLPGYREKLLKNIIFSDNNN